MNFKHAANFPQHPPEHPLWRDINFTPPEVYTTLIKPLLSNPTQQSKKIAKGSKSVARSAPDVTQSWEPHEDNVLAFQFSELGKAENVNYEIIGACLGRSSNAVKCRWHSYMKKKVETLDKKLYRAMVSEGYLYYKTKGK